MALRPAGTLGWVLRTFINWWENSTRPPNQGSMAAVTVPAFLLLQALVRRKTWEFGGKGKQRSAEAVGKLHSCKRNYKARGTSAERSTVMMKQVIT